MNEAVEAKPNKMSRRSFLLSCAMWLGLVASYGTGALYVFRYLLPVKKKKRLRKIYVAPLSDFSADKSMKFKLPDGSEALVLKLGDRLTALSNTCPHLGCKVKWRQNEHDFFCPCHNGEFNEEGQAIAGPPKAENKNLKKYDLKIVGESVFLQFEEV